MDPDLESTESGNDLWSRGSCMNAGSFLADVHNQSQTAPQADKAFRGAKAVADGASRAMLDGLILERPNGTGERQTGERGAQGKD